MKETADLVIVRNFIKSMVDSQNVEGEKELRLSIKKMDDLIIKAVRDFGKEPVKESYQDKLKEFMTPEQNKLFEKQVESFKDIFKQAKLDKDFSIIVKDNSSKYEGSEIDVQEKDEELDLNAIKKLQSKPKPKTLKEVVAKNKKEE